MIRELAAFFTLAFAISWTLWVPVALSGESIDRAWARWLLYAGIAGPALAALVLLYGRGTRTEREDFWDRLFEFRRVGLRWLAVITLCYPLLTALAVGLDWALWHRIPDTRVLDQVLANPATLLAYAGFTLLLGPIPEELGWRGYALDRLQSRWTPLVSSLLLGIAWAAWHLPAFLIRGTYQHGLGLGRVDSGLFVVSVIGLSVLMTWVYNTTGRSILSAILFHGVVNSTRATVTVSLDAEAMRTLLLVAVAIVVALSWRA